MRKSTPSGIARLMSAMVARTLSEIWIALEPGAAKMPIATAGLLSRSERSA
jgi:hypothetical protein